LKLCKQTSFIVDSNLNCLKTVLDQYEALKPDWISQKDWLGCQLALAEGFTNAVRHAHKNMPPETAIEISISITNVYLEIKIWDYGHSFNLTSFKQSLSSSNEHSIGGRGIEILDKIADELRYDRHLDNRNCLTIKKNLKH